MAESEGNWSLIESDPGVFTELIKKFGATGVQVEELWSLDSESFEELKPIHGLIFLFKWMPDKEPCGTIVQDRRLENIFFAKQVINNACATQAVISILLNCNHPDLELGPELSKLKDFAMSFDPNMRGLAISNCDTIREVHNSMARQTLFEFDSKAPSKEEDAFHFIGYMPIFGRLYELDGLRDGPIDHGPIASHKNWFEDVQPIIQKRIQKYNEGAIHFNLMAIVSDRKMIYERKLNELLTRTTRDLMETDIIQMEQARLRYLIEAEEVKMEQYQVEMARRRHNYLPFIIELLKVLGEEGKLMAVYDDAKQRALKKAKKLAVK